MDLNLRLLGSLIEVEVQAASDLLASVPTPFVLDVREPMEFMAGHILGATLIPLGQLGARLSEIPQGRPVLCICRSGARSLTATRQLQAAGHQAINLRGGMLSWIDEGLPIRRGES